MTFEQWMMGITVGVVLTILFEWLGKALVERLIRDTAEKPPTERT